MDVTRSRSTTPVSVSPASSPRPEEGEVDDRLAELRELLGVIAPLVEEDGGQLRLVEADVESGRVVVELAGACGTCAVSAVTLEQGVARILKQRLSWVVEVSGRAVDDGTGATGMGGWVPAM